MKSNKNKKYDIFYWDGIIIVVNNYTLETRLVADDENLFIHCSNNRNYMTLSKKKDVEKCTYIENWIYKNCNIHNVSEVINID